MNKLTTDQLYNYILNSLEDIISKYDIPVIDLLMTIFTAVSNVIPDIEEEIDREKIQRLAVEITNLNLNEMKELLKLISAIFLMFNEKLNIENNKELIN